MTEITGEVNGKKVIAAEAEVKENSPGHFTVYSEGRSVDVFLTPLRTLSDGNSIDGIEVTLESEIEKVTRERFGSYQNSAKFKGHTKGMTLKASMPGMVKSVSVSPGDKVQKNTPVLVLEAMKMENSIAAGFEGVVEKIYITPGMSVEKNAPLIEYKIE